EPWGQARSDFAIFADLAKTLGIAERFTEGRDERAWLLHLYEEWRSRVGDDGGSAPTFDEFWEAGFLEMGGVEDDLVLLERFRADPEGTPLSTPSGKLEIFSATIDGFRYDDCPGHPTWLEPTEWLGAPLAIRTRCASTATRTSSPSIAAPRSSRRAARASTHSWRSSAGRARCRRFARTTRRRPSSDQDSSRSS